ncbi:hypothetical protein [Gemmatimonas phototrophica]|uniref:Response regulatory domain-containing protein n=1 Tax=Gemmatimonas phototrophica TaxID=1379270 RepID=A0A143BLS4_9BACT|nr:hypothetical protein [Gemmatimonas phototrophica]AMW05461.1 hypothetical protein GEMMAAP_12900 [Gemmatimonas phototrophica]
MIVVYSTNRVWRTAVAAALRVHDVDVRMASRQAELAKCLAHSPAAVVIAGAEAGRYREAMQTLAALPSHSTGTHVVHATTPDDTMEDIVRRALS